MSYVKFPIGRRGDLEALLLDLIEITHLAHQLDETENAHHPAIAHLIKRIDDLAKRTEINLQEIIDDSQLVLDDP